jgi:membrane protein
METPDRDTRDPAPARGDGDDAPRESLQATLTELAGRGQSTTRRARAEARLVDWMLRITARGPLRIVAEVVWSTARRDASIAGSVLAAAIAYRIFILLIPVSLFFVVAFGVYAQTADADPTEALDSIGVTGYFAASVAQASGSISGLARVAALLVAGWLVLYETLILLRTLRSVSALAWRIPIPPLGNPVMPTFALLALTIGSIVAGQAIVPLRAHLGESTALLLGLIALLLLPAYWLVVSYALLPHAAQRWTDLVPGALVVGAGAAVLHLFYVLFLFPWLGRKEETYGVLGVSAGLLFGFFLVGRTIELASSLNAVLVERRRDPASD